MGKFSSNLMQGSNTNFLLDSSNISILLAIKTFLVIIPDDLYFYSQNSPI